MSSLDHIQRTMFAAVRQPLTAAEGMRQRTSDGRSMHRIAEEIIKPNDRLTSFERLEIYNRQYWFRVLSALAEDFEGLRLIVGDRNFEKLCIAYLRDCPSQSFTLRNLGSRLESWLCAHRKHIAGAEDIALDMVRLEWAEIEAFDETARPALTESDLPQLGPDPRFSLQPYVRLLDLQYPVDEVLLAIRRDQREIDIVSNAVTERPPRRRARMRSLPQPQKLYLAVHRADNSVYFKRLDPEAFAILNALRDGKRLSEAVEHVNWRDVSGEQAAENLQAWFALWSSLGWFCKSD
jgi:putative DNA-binding protein